MPSDFELRRAYDRLLAVRTGEGGGGCIQPESILALVEKSDDEEMRLRTLDHVMACPSCRQEFELLKALNPVTSRQGTPRRSLFSFAPRGLAWAASLILLVGAGSLWMGALRPDPETVLRGDETELRLVSPEAGGPIREGMTFVWHPLPDGFEYTVEILDQEGEVVFAGSTRDTTFTVAGPIQGGDSRGLRWWVTARTGNGARTSSEVRLLGPPTD
jgi:hypothetical protein